MIKENNEVVDDLTGEVIALFVGVVEQPQLPDKVRCAFNKYSAPVYTWTYKGVEHHFSSGWHELLFRSRLEHIRLADLAAEIEKWHERFIREVLPFMTDEEKEIVNMRRTVIEKRKASLLNEEKQAVRELCEKWLLPYNLIVKEQE